ncbi:hypothetical protein Trydic_g18911 [Trypoxylus dichotomus]
MIPPRADGYEDEDAPPLARLSLIAITGTLPEVHSESRGVYTSHYPGSFSPGMSFSLSYQADLQGDIRSLACIVFVGNNDFE